MVKVYGGSGFIDVTLDVPKGMQVKNWENGRFYEQKMLEHIYKNYSGGTFIDAGSALGNHSMFFAKFCKCKVLSIEPILSSIQKQLEMVEMNGLGFKTIMVNTAVSNYNGAGKMHHFGEAVGLWRLEAGEEVDVTTIDTLVSRYKLDDVTLLKLDIEGSEYKALEGAVNLLQEQHPSVFVEVNEDHELKRVRAFLSRFGYKMVNTFPGRNFEFR